MVDNFYKPPTSVRALLAEDINKQTHAAFAQVADRFSEVVNVKDKTFGAKADGTNDTAAIQVAIDATTAAGGAVVDCPPGTYIVSDIDSDGNALELKTGVHLRGAGEGVTIIKLAANENNVRVIKCNPSQTDMSISNLTVDGNRANQGTPTGLLQGIAGSHNIDGMTIRNVVIKNVFGRSISTNADGALDDALGDEATNIVLHNVRISNGGTKGVQVRRSTHVSVTQCHVDGAGVVDSNSDSAFEASRSRYVTFSANTAVGTIESPGYRVVNDSQYVTVVGNISKAGRQGLVCIDAKNVVFANNIIVDALTDGCLISASDMSNIWDGITRNIIVQGNIFLNPDNDGVVVVVDSGNNGISCDNITIINNIMFDDGANVMDFGIRISPESGTITCRQANNAIINAQTEDISPPEDFTTFPAIQSNNFFTASVSIADDTAISVAVPDGTRTGVFEIIRDLTPAWTMAMTYRAESGASEVNEIYNLLTARVDITTGVLTGTTGMDTNLTISAHTDGKIYIENRGGSTLRFTYTFRTCV